MTIPITSTVPLSAVAKFVTRIQKSDTIIRANSKHRRIKHRFFTRKKCSFKEMGQNQTLLMAVNKSHIGFMQLNLAFTITCNQKCVHDCPFNTENCNANLGITKYPTKIIFSFFLNKH